MSAGNKTNVTALLDDLPAFSRQTRGGTFLIIKGPDRGESIRLVDKPIYFGSSPSCEMVLSDKPVSRRHLMAALEGESVVLRDQGSTNGTFINGELWGRVTTADFSLVPFVGGCRV